MLISRRALGGSLMGAGVLGANLFSQALAQGKATLLPLNVRGPLPKAALDAPAFQSALTKARKSVAIYLKQRPDVPVPKDVAGGYTHERHRDNYRLIRESGSLYAFTGQSEYAVLVRDVLFAYADLYPTLGLHPNSTASQKGKLFWQSLNDSVWLVEAIQGYADIRDTLTPAERTRIENGVFRPMVQFMSVDSAKTFELIHNHATWAVAGVGMTGYVIGEPLFVKQAFYGLKGDGTSGFLRQIDLLFSPDGYYAEGPYYQRYAIQPFMLFARFIEQYDPAKKIFEHRDRMLIKSFSTLVQLTYDGAFFPLNDAIVGKSLDSPELVQSVAIVYALTKDPTLLSIAAWQGGVAFMPEGAGLALAMQTLKAQPVEYTSNLFRDGADGKAGALAVLRNGKGDRAQALVFKATAQGMGHGHFDRLSWIFYDGGREVLADYGAARYLNVEAKDGGRYLKENESWAKQTLAHNTLVVDEGSQFAGKVKNADPVGTTFLSYGEKEGVQLASARLDAAYTDVKIWRAVMMVSRPELRRPIIVDIVRARGKGPHRYDLPMHYKGVFLKSSLAFAPETATQAPMGTQAGYQHLWVKAQSPVVAGSSSFSWFNTDRLYALTFDASQASKAYMTQLGANDPNDNLRPERSLILRADAQADFNYAGVIEAYGAYNASDESVRDIDPAVVGVKLIQDGGRDLVLIDLKGGKQLAIGLDWDGGPASTSSLSANSKVWSWRGGYGVATSK